MIGNLFFKMKKLSYIIIKTICLTIAAWSTLFVGFALFFSLASESNPLIKWTEIILSILVTVFMTHLIIKEIIKVTK